MGETNFTFGPIPKFDFLFFDIDLLFPRIQALQATFKAVLIAVYMTMDSRPSENMFWGSYRVSFLTGPAQKILSASW